MSQLSPEKWAEAQRLFARALDLPPVERAGFLERECADAEVLCEVRSLLEYSGDDLRTAAAAIAAAASAVGRETDPDERLIGARLGPYKVEAIAGHGGMGAVYRASRDDGEYRQEVAIKLVRAAAQSQACCIASSRSARSWRVWRTPISRVCWMADLPPMACRTW
jgi:hypothetical protein